MNDIIILKFKQKEVQREVPKGFWELSPQDRENYIKITWPNVEWAGNGNPNPLYSCSHFFENK